MTGWATAVEVQDITGGLPTDATLALAQAIIEDVVNRTPDAVGAFSLRDLQALKKAVAWQAAWIPSQPDLLTRVGVTGVSQDGLNATYRSAVDQFVAPLAQRAIKNLSWMGTRSVKTTSRPERYPELGWAATSAAFLHSGADSEYGWDHL